MKRKDDLCTESDLSDRSVKIELNVMDKHPWGFCVTKDSTCTANMCDEYGCQDAKGNHTEGPEELTTKP